MNWEQFKAQAIDGATIKCCIHGVYVEGQIRIAEQFHGGLQIFILQNKMHGSTPYDKDTLGYKYAWVMKSNLFDDLSKIEFTNLPSSDIIIIN